jgi:hypothetical protein
MPVKCGLAKNEAARDMAVTSTNSDLVRSEDSDSAMSFGRNGGHAISIALPVNPTL